MTVAASALHVTNGDAAIDPLRSGGVEGRILPWRDVLHDGPVPAAPWDALRETRARFIATAGWATYDEVLAELAERDAALLDALTAGNPVTLWFEHDLYDQLQVAQVLAMAAPAVRGGAGVQLAQADDYLGTMDDAAVRALASRTRPIMDADVLLAERAWSAFTSNDPEALPAFVQGEHEWERLPWLRPALDRLLAERPDATGLGRMETQALRAYADGPRAFGSAYRAAHHDAEDPIWLGDASFDRIVQRLATADPPLVERIGEDMCITMAGRGALSGTRPATILAERWCGGVRLRG